MLTKLTFALGLVALTSAALTMDHEARDAIVNGHNELREATGANMEPMVWSEELAQYAAGRTDECVFAHDSEQEYGENLYGAGATIGAADASARAVAAWASEISRVDEDWNCAFTGDHDTTCGHYSQMVWATTTSVGCGVTNCPGPFTYVFCEYSPAGNVMKWDWDTMSAVNQPPY